MAFWTPENNTTTINTNESLTNSLNWWFDIKQQPPLNKLTPEDQTTLLENNATIYQQTRFVAEKNWETIPELWDRNDVILPTDENWNQISVKDIWPERIPEELNN